MILFRNIVLINRCQYNHSLNMRFMKKELSSYLASNSQEEEYDEWGIEEDEWGFLPEE